VFGCSNVLFTVVLIDGWIIIYDCTVRYDTCRSEQERREFILVCVLGSSSEFDEGVVRQKNSCENVAKNYCACDMLSHEGLGFRSLNK
jgi:hypothetical protein